MNKVKYIPKLVGEFIQKHALAALSTQSVKDNYPHIAFIYYIPDKEVRNLYFASRSESGKVKNIIAHSHIALAIVDQMKLSTLQIEGTAKLLSNQEYILNLYDDLTKVANELSGLSFPPIMMLEGGSIEVIEIRIRHFRYSNFSERKPKFIEGELT